MPSRINFSHVLWYGSGVILAGLLAFASIRYYQQEYKTSTNESSLIHKNSEISLAKLTSLSEILKINDSIVPVAVIGSGPAGLSAALYTARLNLYTVVFKGNQPGGQLMGTSLIENWPGIGSKEGPVVMQELEKQAESFGAHMVPQSIDRVDLSSWPYTLYTDEGQVVKALSVVIATGSTPRRKDIPGEQEYWGRGVSTCAVCDAPFYKDKVVAVIGGGDSAAEHALQLSAVAREVTLIVRGPAMRASAIMQERLKERTNIKIRFNTDAIKVLGNDKRITGVELQLPDKSKETLTIDGFFLAIGHEPNTQLFKDQLKLDAHGYVVLSDRSQLASKPGIFAAGDVADYRYKQAGVASGDGIKAALDASTFLTDIGFNEKTAVLMQDRYFEVVDPKTLDETLVTSVKSLAEVENILKTEKRPVVIDFYAPYCPSCMQMLPAVLSVANKLHDIRFLKVDTSVVPEVAKKFDVSMIPALIVYKNNKLISRSTEAMNKRQLLNYARRFIESPQEGSLAK